MKATAKRKVIAFDLDGTLSESKSPISDTMAILLGKLLQEYHVCIMSGGKFEQFEKQLLANLKLDAKALSKLHIMPTCGTRYYRYQNKKWQKLYAEDLTELQKQKIIKALVDGAEKLGLAEKKTWGEVIEDRGSQISWSALGQDIVDHLGLKGVQMKEQWDPSHEKKRKLRDHVASAIPEFEVRTGGSSTIDVTKKGVDKAYGINKLLDMLSISKEDVFFIGDRLEEGGNDYPVKKMGVDCLSVSHWKETAQAIENILATA